MRTSLLILGDLAEEDILFLSKAGHLRDFAPGEDLVTAGEAPPDVSFVTRGMFDVILPTGTKVAKLEVGDVVGEMSFVEDRLPDTSVTASEPARVLAVPKTALARALSDDPAFAGRFYKALSTFLSDRLRRVTAELGGGSGNDVQIDERVLEMMHVAGDRMNRLIALLEGEDGI